MDIFCREARLLTDWSEEGGEKVPMWLMTTGFHSGLVTRLNPTCLA